MLIYLKIDRHKNSKSVSLDKVVSDIINLMEQDTEIVYKGKDKKPVKRFSVPTTQQTYLKDLKDDIRVILCNLISAYQTDPDIYIAFMLKNGYYTKKDKSKEGFKFASSNVQKITDFLEKYEYIDLIKGKKPSPNMYGQNSRMRLLPEIQSLIPNMNDIEVYKDPTHIKKITMKGLKNKNTNKRKVIKIPSNEMPKARLVEANILKINQFLQKTKIELNVSLEELRKLNETLSKDPDKYINPIDFTNKYLRRTFHDRTFDAHGRWYSSWFISAPQEYRERILLNGMPVIIRDFQAYHPALCYCEANKKIPSEDPYILPDTKYIDYTPNRKGPYRDFNKRVLLRLLNTSTDWGAINSVRNELREEQEKAFYLDLPYNAPPVDFEDDTTMKEIVRLLKERHEPIKKFFKKKGVGEKLLTKDSKLMEKILLNLLDKGIPALPVHDEIIVPLDRSTECWKIMEYEFEKMFHQKIEITGSFSEALYAAIERPKYKKHCSKWYEMEEMAIKGAGMIDDEEHQKHWQ